MFQKCKILYSHMNFVKSSQQTNLLIVLHHQIFLDGKWMKIIIIFVDHTNYEHYRINWSLRYMFINKTKQLLYIKLTTTFCKVAVFSKSSSFFQGTWVEYTIATWRDQISYISSSVNYIMLIDCAFIIKIIEW